MNFLKSTEANKREKIASDIFTEVLLHSFLVQSEVKQLQLRLCEKISVKKILRRTLELR